LAALGAQLVSRQNQVLQIPEVYQRDQEFFACAVADVVAFEVEILDLHGVFLEVGSQEGCSWEGQIVSTHVQLIHLVLEGFDEFNQPFVSEVIVAQVDVFGIFVL